MKCILPTCGNRQNRGNAAISFHKFPSDEMCKNKWIAALQLSADNVKKHSIVCSKHFHEHDFVGEHRRLTAAAIPHLHNLDCGTDDDESLIEMPSIQVSDDPISMEDEPKSSNHRSNEMVCRLCFVETELYLPLKNVDNHDKGAAVDILAIITKHFDLPFDIDSDVICDVCWQQISEFHSFYLFIEQKQKEHSLENEVVVFTNEDWNTTEVQTVEKAHPYTESDDGTDEEAHTHPENYASIAEKQKKRSLQKKVVTFTYDDWNATDVQTVEVAHTNPASDDEVHTNTDCHASDAETDDPDETQIDAESDDWELETDDEGDLEKAIKTYALKKIAIAKENRSINIAEGPQGTKKSEKINNGLLIDPLTHSTSRSKLNSSEISNDVATTAGAIKIEIPSYEKDHKYLDTRNTKGDNNDNAFECDLCDERLECFKKVKLHFEDKHNCEGYVVCCKKPFYRIQHYAYHMKNHLKWQRMIEDVQCD